MSIDVGFRSWADVVRLGKPKPPSQRKKGYSLLRKEGGALSPLDSAFFSGNEERVRTLVNENPGLLHSRNAIGFTPVLEACFWGVSSELLKFLLKSGGDARVMAVAGGHTPEVFARAGGHKELLSLLPVDPMYTNLYFDSKELGHLFSLSGQVYIERGISFKVVGAWSSCWLNLLLGGVRGYSRTGRSTFSRNQTREIESQLERLKERRADLAKYRESLERDSPYVVITGWQGHVIVVIFWRSFFIVCDPSSCIRGRTISVFKIDPTLCSQQMLDAMTGFKKRAEERVGIIYFSSLLPKKLGAKEAQLFPEDREVIDALQAVAPPPITVGICSFASLLITVMVVATAKGVSQRPGRSVLPIAKRVTNDVVRMRTYMQAGSLYKYLVRHASNPKINRRLLWSAYKILQRNLPMTFSHLHDVSFTTPSGGKIRGDELMRRISRMMPKGKRRRRRYGR